MKRQPDHDPAPPLAWALVLILLPPLAAAALLLLA